MQLEGWVLVLAAHDHSRLSVQCSPSLGISLLPSLIRSCSWVHALASKTPGTETDSSTFGHSLRRSLWTAQPCPEWAQGDLVEGQIEPSAAAGVRATKCLPALSEPESRPDLLFWLYTLAPRPGVVLEPSEIKISELNR